MTGESFRSDLSGVTGVSGIDTLKELAAQVALAGSCLLVLTHANMSHWAGAPGHVFVVGGFYWIMWQFVQLATPAVEESCFTEWNCGIILVCSLGKSACNMDVTPLLPTPEGPVLQILQFKTNWLIHLSSGSRGQNN